MTCICKLPFQLTAVPAQVLAAATSGQISFASNPLPGSLPLQSLGVAGSASPLVAAVYTAQEFQEAFTEGIRDIEIHAHLDLQNLPIPIAQWITGVEGEFTFQVGFVSPTTRSIRVCFLSINYTVCYTEQHGKTWHAAPPTNAKDRKHLHSTQLAAKRRKSQTKHQAPSKGQPNSRMTPTSTAAMHTSITAASCHN